MPSPLSRFICKTAQEYGFTLTGFDSKFKLLVFQADLEAVIEVWVGRKGTTVAIWDNYPHQKTYYKNVTQEGIEMAFGARMIDV